jgi:hypothetical protein
MVTRLVVCNRQQGRGVHREADCGHWTIIRRDLSTRSARFANDQHMGELGFQRGVDNDLTDSAALVKIQTWRTSIAGSMYSTARSIAHETHRCLRFNTFSDPVRTWMGVDSTQC